MTKITTTQLIHTLAKPISEMIEGSYTPIAIIGFLVKADGETDVHCASIDDAYDEEMKHIICAIADSIRSGEIENRKTL